MSNNLNFDQVAENQALKEVTINTATGQADAALTEKLTVDLTSGNVTLTATQYRRNMVFYADNVATSGREINLPTNKKLSVFESDAGNTNAIDVNMGSTAYTLSPGGVVVVYTDGTANGMTVIAESGAGAIRPYDVATFCVGLPAAAEKLLRLNYVRTITLPANLVGSRVTATSAATAQTDFDLRVNGGSEGTIRFAIGGTVATFVGIASDLNIAVNDILEIVAPGSQDATLADISFTLAGVQI